MFQCSKGRTKKFDQDVLTFNTLKWEITMHAMRCFLSEIKQFIQVNYNSETIKKMIHNCFSVKLRKFDPDQPMFLRKWMAENWKSIGKLVILSMKLPESSFKIWQRIFTTVFLSGPIKISTTALSHAMLSIVEPDEWRMRCVSLPVCIMQDKIIPRHPPKILFR